MQDLLIKFLFLTTNVRVYKKFLVVTNTLAYFVIVTDGEEEKEEKNAHAGNFSIIPIPNNKCQTIQKVLASDKHSSLFCHFTEGEEAKGFVRCFPDSFNLL